MLAHEINSVAGRRRLHSVIWIIAVLMVILIGLSRIYLGVHYLSDVVAGDVAGAAWLIAMIVAEREFPGWRHRRREKKGVLKHAERR